MVDVKMPLTAHLEELRSRLIKSLLAIAVGFGGSYYVADRLFEILTRPLLALNAAMPNGDSVHLIGTGVGEGFFTKLKVSAIAGLFLASPVLLYQLWMFIAP